MARWMALACICVAVLAFPPPDRTALADEGSQVAAKQAVPLFRDLTKDGPKANEETLEKIKNVRIGNLRNNKHLGEIRYLLIFIVILNAVQLIFLFFFPKGLAGATEWTKVSVRDASKAFKNPGTKAKARNDAETAKPAPPTGKKFLVLAAVSLAALAAILYLVANITLTAQ